MDISCRSEKNKNRSSSSSKSSQSQPSHGADPLSQSVTKAADFSSNIEAILSDIRQSTKEKITTDEDLTDLLEERFNSAEKPQREHQQSSPEAVKAISSKVRKKLANQDRSYNATSSTKTNIPGSSNKSTYSQRKNTPSRSDTLRQKGTGNTNLDLTHESKSGKYDESKINEEEESDGDVYFKHDRPNLSELEDSDSDGLYYSDGYKSSGNLKGKSRRKMNTLRLNDPTGGENATRDVSGEPREEEDYDMTSTPIYGRSVNSPREADQLPTGRRKYKHVEKASISFSDSTASSSEFTRGSLFSDRSLSSATSDHSSIFQKPTRPFAGTGFGHGSIGQSALIQQPRQVASYQHPVPADIGPGPMDIDSDNPITSSEQEESAVISEKIWGNDAPSITSGKKEETVQRLSSFFPHGRSSFNVPLEQQLELQSQQASLHQQTAKPQYTFSVPSTPFVPASIATLPTWKEKTSDGGAGAFMIDIETDIASMDELNAQIIQFDAYLKKVTSSQAHSLEHISEDNTHHDLLALFHNRAFRVSWIIAQTQFNKREKETFNSWRLNRHVPQLHSEAYRAAASLAELSPRTIQRRALGLLYPDESVTQTDVKQWNRRYYGEYGDLLNAMAKVLNSFEGIVDDDSEGEETEREGDDNNAKISSTDLADLDPLKYYTYNNSSYRVSRKTMESIKLYYKTQMRIVSAQQKMEICKRHNEAVKENSDISKRIFGVI